MANLQFLEHLPQLLLREVKEGRAAVVGGAIRSHFDHTPLSDIDVFVFSKENYDNIVLALGCEPVEGAGGCIHTVPDQSVKIDLVFDSACTSAEQCVLHTDFDIASGVYSLGKFYFPEGYHEAIGKKVMRFLQTRHPASSYWRYVKYNREYGYRIDGSIQELLEEWRKSQARVSD